MRYLLGKLMMFAQFVQQRLNSYRIRTAANVSIAPGVYIARTATVEVRRGGSVSIGKNTEVMDGVLILTYGGPIRIGEECSINPYTIIYGHGGVEIGDHVLIAGGCMIVPSSHNYKDPDKPIGKQYSSFKGIRIGSDVWIGHGCSILDGVVIGSGSIIAAGSVVNQSVPENSVFGGVPAKLLKSRFE
jgi:acetyltransferase-like isoleucine patch superfamily enzyme